MASAPRAAPAHHFTVDVEEYFQVSAFETVVRPEAWDRFESRVAQGVDRLLELLASHGAAGTFFVLGWLAGRYPELVRRIAVAGHEIASHGWDHRRVTDQSTEAFRTSVHRTKHTLEQLTGAPVVGFRAPNFSIIPGLEWAFDILIEEGYGYDSSLFPAWRSGSGYRSSPRDPYWLERPAGRLAELPPATLRRLGLTMPAGGGAYFRLLPYGFVTAALRDCERRGVPATFYIHPWEVDPAQPRVDVPWLTRLRHYGGLNGTLPRLRRLLGEFCFAPIGATVAKL
jgi:polysaccharide deacetylase family protein (PEP-CTERM system associated)